jgi:hypothetical protein
MLVHVPAPRDLWPGVVGLAELPLFDAQDAL